MKDLTAERLRALFLYEPDTGAFRRRTGRERGKIAGGINEKGHRRIRVGARKYYAGRLAFLYVNGRWPVEVIDHRNGDPDDNRIANLREAESWQNATNSRNKKPGSLGLRGVRAQKTGGYQAQINHHGKRYTLGTFRTKEEAHAAYLKESRRVHGEFSTLVPDPLPPKPAASVMIPIRRPLPSLAAIREMLDYDALTGIFTWRTDRSRSAKNGQVAGHRMADGHIILSVLGMRVHAHRLAWTLAHDEWPTLLVDHINGVPDDNRISNLRLATRAQNIWNRAGRPSPKSPLKGVRLASRTSDRWQASIGHQGKTFYLGIFPSAEEAHAAYREAADRLFGEFARYD